MGLVKEKLLQRESNFSGSVDTVAINGAYLFIFLNDALMHIATIPPPNLLGEFLHETVVRNHDDFTDTYGNAYEISIASSRQGIEWEMVAYPDDVELASQIHFEVKLNEY